MTAKKTPHVHADHPRACGANGSLMCLSLLSAGSSPRVRGKHLDVDVRLCAVRIIPARAGQTRPASACCIAASDHPRACGANSNVCLSGRSPPGSSPRVRGKPGPLGLLPVAGRIIPARAGQTRCRSGNILYPPDHPRACGANLASRRFHNGLSGSSPRVRGKPSLRPSMIRGFRIIPARAGQTPRSKGILDPKSDHPRACGANPDSSWTRRSPFGSSPRVRGKRPAPNC